MRTIAATGLALALLLALTACGGSGPQAAGAAPSAGEGSGGDIVLTRNQAVGDPYGAPGPRTCSTFKTPAQGPPSADQIAKYVICASEFERPTAATLYLIDQVQITSVSPGRPYNPNQDANMDRIDLNRPVYDFQGTAVSYACYQLVKPGEYDAGPFHHQGGQCTSYTEAKALGACYQTTAGDWSCGMLDEAALTNGQHNVPPPPND